MYLHIRMNNKSIQVTFRMTIHLFSMNKLIRINKDKAKHLVLPVCIYYKRYLNCNNERNK